MTQNTEQRVNPLIEKLRIPGETYRLPSQGLFYHTGELDPSVKNGELEVYPMTAIDEVILSTPDKLLSGNALIEVMARCIPQITRPRDLLSRDVDYLMACLRIVSFGEKMTVVSRHNCEKSKEHNYDIDLTQMVRQSKIVDPTTLKTEYAVTLPNGQRVVLKPLTFGAVIDLYQTTALTKQNELTEDEASKLVVSTLVSVIESVDGIADRLMIEEWVILLKLGWKKLLEQAAQKTSNWGIDFATKSKCKDCGEEIELVVSPNPISFFT